MNNKNIKLNDNHMIVTYSTYSTNLDKTNIDILHLFNLFHILHLLNLHNILHLFNMLKNLHMLNLLNIEYTTITLIGDEYDELELLYHYRQYISDNNNIISLLYN